MGEPGDRIVELEDDAVVGAILGQFVGKGMGVARQVGGAVDAAGEGLAPALQGGLHGGARLGVEVFEFQAVGAQVLGLDDGAAHLALAAVDMQDAAVLGVERDRKLVADGGQQGPVVERQLDHRGGVGAAAAGPALGQEACQEADQRRIGPQVDRQRRVAAAQPGEQLERRPRVRPRRRMRGRNLAAVGEAGLQPRPGLAVDHGDLMAGAQQVIGGAHTDNPGAEHDDFHGVLSS